MRKVGNVVSNRIYNPNNRKPPVPVDVDEADAAMERFIRQKYMNNVARSSSKPRSPLADDDIPPPLPPKNSTTSSKFGLRSASALLPLSSRSKKDAKNAAGADAHRPLSHGSAGKASRVFGASVNYDDADDMDRKLGKLRDMGFYDTQRNAIVLKGVNGNLDKAIESLVRLGEGDKGSSYAPPPPPRDSPPRTASSLPPHSSTPGSGRAQGLNVPPQLSQNHLPVSPSGSSTNPFDAMSTPTAPQTAQSTGSLHTNNPYNQSLNPFESQAQPTDYFAQAFQNLNISSNSNNTRPPLFPNRTGGLTPQLQEQPTPPPMPWHAAPSAPSSPQAYQNMTLRSLTHPQPGPLQQQPTGHNPFFTNTTGSFQLQQQQHQSLPNLSLSTQQPHMNGASNPFNRPPAGMTSPQGLGQIPEQSQPSFQSASPAQYQAGGTNPFMSSPIQTPTQIIPPQHYAQQGGYMQPPRHDKASIMALYGASPAVPRTTLSTDDKQTPAMTSIPENQATQVQPASPTSVQHQNGVAQPVPQASATNPFMNGGVSGSGSGSFTARKPSRDSVNLGMDLAWTNGRHSPDAFASLSAKHG